MIQTVMKSDLELFVRTVLPFGKEDMFTIHELRGKALEKALQDTKEAEFDGEEVSVQTLVDYNEMTGAVYNENGDFIAYCIEKYK